MDVAGIGQKEKERYPVGYTCGYWGTEEAHLESVDEEEVKGGIERGGEEEDVCSWSHYFLRGVSDTFSYELMREQRGTQTLSLQVLFHTFEIDVAQTTGYQTPQEASTVM